MSDVEILDAETPYKITLPDTLAAPPGAAAQANRDSVIRGFQALAAGARDLWWDLLDPQILFHEAASLPYGGAHRGLEAARRAHDHIYEVFDRLHAEVEQVMAAGDLVVACLTLSVRARQTGRSVTLPVTETYRFRDGRIVEWRALYFDTRLICDTVNETGRENQTLKRNSSTSPSFTT